jgi:lipopolysaccharide/colanic/teichoic acid biosynthesis glycosyltransferase
MKNRSQFRATSRTGEICLALAGLTVLLPLLILFAVMIRSSSRGPVLFRQRRVGLEGSEFVLYKFRSMLSDSNGLKLTAQNDERLTPVGKWLRRYKLDELPQLWNVVRGEMSFVGPRPEVSEYVDLKNPLWREILRVRPGITDPVALRLRNEEQLLASVEDKEAFYVEVLLPFKLQGWGEYVRRKTWKTDVRILFQTFKVILSPNAAPPRIPEELSVAVTD